MCAGSDPAIGSEKETVKSIPPISSVRLLPSWPDIFLFPSSKKPHF